MKSFVKKSGQSFKHPLFAFIIAAIFSSFAIATPSAFAAENPAATVTKAEQQHAKISINKASVAELEALNGVGKKKAAAIVAYRKANGKFKSLDQLIEVKGIGPDTLEKNKALLSL